MISEPQIETPSRARHLNLRINAQDRRFALEPRVTLLDALREHPVQTMSAVGCVREGRADDERTIAEAMSGNLCRCGAYPNIRKAIARAAR